MTVTLSASNGLFHISKPVIFTGLSTFFVLVYFGLSKVSRDEPQYSPISSSSVTYQSEDVTEMLQGLEEQVIFCNSSFQPQLLNTDIPVIHFVTPTYQRGVQLAELTRLGQTLLNVPSLHWILVEDSDKCNPILQSLLNRLNLPFTHMASPMPSSFAKSTYKPRGVSNRRAALNWIRANVKSGVLYFGDDDNTYDLRLFDEIRSTQLVSMFPVGLVGEYAVSTPVVKEGKVVGFFDSWPAGRRFSIDMAGFAVNVDLLHAHPNATMIYKAGYEEDYFLRALHVEPELIEVKAANCTEIYVWHTKTVQVPPATLKPFRELKDPSVSIGNLLYSMNQMRLVYFVKRGTRYG